MSQRLLIAALIAIVPEAAHAAALDGAALRWPWALPFIGILVTIATGPLLFPRLWHRHYGKLAFAWSALTLAPLAPAYGTPVAAPAFTDAGLGAAHHDVRLLGQRRVLHARGRDRRAVGRGERRQRERAPGEGEFPVVA